ncbi:hypothetical protein B566_EDAN004387 [Ephemera danica]|nr:hypothetical protein B566_EDAN004387 [Ephemera danica]
MSTAVVGIEERLPTSAPPPPACSLVSCCCCYPCHAQCNDDIAMSINNINMHCRIAALVLLVCLLCPHPSGGVTEFATRVFVQAIRENLAGLPVVRRQQNWHFNPDEGLTRRRYFEQTHGPRGQWLIKALGEGEGGYPKYAGEQGDHVR